MKLEIEIDEIAIHSKVVEQITSSMKYDANIMLRQMIKDVVDTELRKYVAQYSAELINTMTLPDGRTIKDYVCDAIIARHPERRSVANLIDNAIRENTEKWFMELVKPELAKIKESIPSQIANKLLLESRKP